MSDNFYAYMFGANGNPDTENAETSPSQTEPQDAQVAQDEAIGSPWTHRYTIYCANPSKTFLEELKAKDGVVAVYVKEKETKPETADTETPSAETPPDNQ